MRFRAEFTPTAIAHCVPIDMMFLPAQAQVAYCMHNLFEVQVIASHDRLADSLQINIERRVAALVVIGYPHVAQRFDHLHCQAVLNLDHAAIANHRAKLEVGGNVEDFGGKMVALDPLVDDQARRHDIKVGMAPAIDETIDCLVGNVEAPVPSFCKGIALWPPAVVKFVRRQSFAERLGQISIPAGCATHHRSPATLHKSMHANDNVVQPLYGLPQ